MAYENDNENLIVRTTSLAMHIIREYIQPGDTVVDCTMGNGYDTYSLACAVGYADAFCEQGQEHDQERNLKNSRLGDRIHLFSGRSLKNAGTLDDACTGKSYAVHFGENFDVSAAKTEVCCAVPHTRGKVYAFDVQETALNMTRTYLAANGIKDPEKNGIYLIRASHAEMDRYLEKESSISAFVFNLGFLPGYDKTVMTTWQTSLPAIKKAIRMVRKNGIVSIMAYSGHKEGAEECERIAEYLKKLPSKKNHVACINMINQKRTAPSLFLITPKTDDRSGV